MPLLSKITTGFLTTIYLLQFVLLVPVHADYSDGWQSFGGTFSASFAEAPRTPGISAADDDTNNKVDVTLTSAGDAGALYSDAAIEVDETGLIGYWNFDDTNSLGRDLSGSENHGTPYGVTQVDGKKGKAGSFNSTDGDYIRLSNDISSGNTDWSVSVWVKTSSNGTILSNYDGNPVTNDINVQGGKIGYDHYNGSWNQRQGTSTITDDTWHFLSWVNHGSSQKIDLYVDGILERAGVDSSLVNNGPINNIGKNWKTSSGNFNGIIDELKFYSRSLSLKEVQDRYKQDSLEAYYKFDEGSGSTAYDISGKNNHATIHGANWDAIAQVGSGLLFNGVDEYTEVESSKLKLESSGTFSFWLNFPVLATGKPIIGQWGNSQNAFLIQTDDTNSDEIKVCIASSLTDNCTNNLVTTNTNMALNTWSYVSIVYDGTGAANSDKLKIYKDGIFQGATYSGTIPSSILSSTEELEMGADTDTTVYSNIKLDELSISSRSANINEVRASYETTRPRFELTRSTTSGSGFEVPESITSALSGETINDTYFYDTTKDDIVNLWRDGTKDKDGGTIAERSWHSETIDNTYAACDFTNDDRCGVADFPEKALLVATNSNLYIFDVSIPSINIPAQGTNLSYLKPNI